MKRFTRLCIRALIAGSSIAMTTTGAQAATTINAGIQPLLSAGDGNQLAIWLGKGDLTLTSIFKSNASPLPSTIAAAVDGRGPTFTVMYATGLATGTLQVIGWYNPVNGTAATGGSVGESVYDAFIFNLSADRILRVNATPYSDDVDLVSSRGAGLGIHLVERRGQVETFAAYDYGDDPSKGVFWNPIAPNWNETNLRFGQIEVFSISVDALASPAAVPEPATWAMMIVGFGMVGCAARYKRRETTVTYA